MMNIPTSTAYIYLGVLEDNYRIIKSKLSARTGILGVVKADAYGHGAVNVSHRLEELGVRYLGVATLEEGLELREANVRPPILVMSGLMPWEEVELFERHDLTPVIHDLATLRRIRKHVEGSTIPLKIHLKFDTGMGRLGFMKHDAPVGDRRSPGNEKPFGGGLDEPFRFLREKGRLRHRADKVL